MGEGNSAVSSLECGRLSSIMCVVLLVCEGIRSQCCHGYCSQLYVANGPYRLMASPPDLTLCPGWLVHPVQRVGGTEKSPWQHLSYLHVILCFYVYAVFVFSHLSWHVSHGIFLAKATALDLGSG